MNTLIERAKDQLDLKYFKQRNYPISIRKFEVYPPKKSINILRMCIKHPQFGFKFPSEYYWMYPLFINTCWIQTNYIKRNHPYIYLTIRHGIVNTTTDDVWHVDGFSMRYKHYPEQNYIWSDCYPTEFLIQEFDIENQFDPLKHNIYWYIQDRAKEFNIISANPKELSLIDPYVIHRRPKESFNIQRTFIRISFVPIEIEDDKNTQNPHFPQKIYNNRDIRLSLKRF